MIIRACLQSIDLRLTRVGAARRAAEVREELPAAVDQLPEARPEARNALRRGGEARHRPARRARQQVHVPHVFSASFACAGGALFPTRSLIVDCFLAPPRPPRAGGPRSRRGSPGGRTTRSRTTGTRASGRSSSGWASTPSPTSHCSRNRRPLLLHHRPYNSGSTRSPVHNNIKSRNRSRGRPRR
jgi:hypothetical protein